MQHYYMFRLSTSDIIGSQEDGKGEMPLLTKSGIKLLLLENIYNLFRKRDNITDFCTGFLGIIRCMGLNKKKTVMQNKIRQGTRSQSKNGKMNGGKKPSILTL